MNGLSPLMLLWITWSAITVILVLLIIYRGVVGIHEEDQLFLGRAEAAMEKEQAETLRQIHRLDFAVKAFGAVSGALLLVIAGLWVYGGLYGQAPG
jgi:hypothetical protein